MGIVPFDRAVALRQAALFRNFSDGELSELTQHGAMRRVRKNDLLVFEGEAPQGLLVLLEGVVRVFREGCDGREQVIRNERAVGTLNETQLFDTRPHPASISAAEDCLVLTLPLGDCRHLIQSNSRASQDALELLSKRLHSALDLVDSLALLSVDQRVAQFLLEEARRGRNRFHTELSVDLALSNQQIGAMIGAVREVVSRSLGKLQKLGLIYSEGRTFTIPSESRLENFINRGEAGDVRRRVASW